MIILVILWPITPDMSLVSPGATDWSQDGQNREGWYLYFWWHKLLLTWEVQMDINQRLKLLVKLSSRVSNIKRARQFILLDFGHVFREHIWHTFVGQDIIFTNSSACRACKMFWTIVEQIKIQVIRVIIY